MGVPEGEKRKKRKESIFEGNSGQKLPKFDKKH